MSFAKIGKPLKLRGWKYQNSRNKVEEIILKLVDHAETDVQRETEKCDALVAVRREYPGGVSGLADRMEGVDES